MGLSASRQLTAPPPAPRCRLRVDRDLLRYRDGVRAPDVLGIPTVADDVGVGAEEDLDRRLGRILPR
jgi:hypothetical protein